jgi:hypothetical protein
MTTAGGDALSHAISLTNRAAISRVARAVRTVFRNQSSIIKIVPSIAA